MHQFWRLTTSLKKDGIFYHKIQKNCSVWHGPCVASLDMQIGCQSSRYQCAASDWWSIYLKDWTKTEIAVDWETDRWNGSPALICWSLHSGVTQAEPVRLAHTTSCKYLNTMMQSPGNAKQVPTRKDSRGSSQLLRHHFTTWSQCRAATARPACELCRKTMQEEIRAAMEHLLPPETHHASSSAAWKDLACYDLSEAPWQPMMMEMHATFILLSRQNEEQRCQGASARWKIASFSEKWRLARNFSSNFSHHSYLKSSAMVISPNLPRPSWLFSYNSTPWNPNTKFCLHIPSTSQQHPWKIHLQSQEQKVTTKKPAPFHQEKEKRFTSKPAWGLLFDLRG